MKNVVFFLLLFCIYGAQAQWSNNPNTNNPVCTTAGVQDHPRIIRDGTGGAFITWKDERSSSNYDIYVQRIDSGGNVRWTANGIAVCTATGIQNYPQLASDGKGGVIITWMDYRDIFIDIYAQRIDSSGNVQWVSNGVAVCLATFNQGYPQITGDGKGGAIITWDDFRSGNNHDIYAQRIDSSGNILWENNGVAICNEAGTQRDPQITADSSHGAIITWWDSRNINIDIYAQRIDLSGAVQWDSNGVAICISPNNQYFPQITSEDSGGAIIAWYDLRSGNDQDVYAQLIDSTGGIHWADNGTAVCTETGDQNNPQIKNSSPGKAIIAWQDSRSGSNSDIYAQLLSSGGSSLWTNNGVAVCTEPGNQNNPQVIASGESGEAIIAWEDFRSGTNSDLYAQRISSSGEVQWTNNGVTVSIATGSQRYPQITGDGSAGGIITWQDTRNGIYDIYAQLVNSDGQLGIFTNIEDRAKALGFALLQNYPNPFTQNTNLSWKTLAYGQVVLKVYDFMGKEIRTLVNENQSSGQHQVPFNTESLPVGMYFCQLSVNGIIETKKMVLCR